MSPILTEEAARVLIEALRQSKSSNTLELDKIVDVGKTTESFAKTILIPVLGEDNDGRFSLDSKARVQLALEIARAGLLKDAARALTWQEFESFGAECLVEAGFAVEKNVRVKGGGRGWQIDLIGYRGDLVLTIDCKHWNASGYESRLEPPAKHQRTAMAHFLRTLLRKTIDPENKLQGLAVILTLLEPPVAFLENTAVVSVEKLPSFLNAVTPYDLALPLMSMSDLVVENPIS